MFDTFHDQASGWSAELEVTRCVTLCFVRLQTLWIWSFSDHAWNL